jgi:hypothetical protein
MKARKLPIQPFKIPTGYLEGFKVSLPQKEKLSARSNKPFTTPETYFKDFKVAMPQTISPTVKVVSLYKKYSWMAAAAVLFIIMATTFFTIGNFPNTNKDPIAAAAIDEYWEYATDALTTYDMAAFIIENTTALDHNTLASEGLESYLESSLHPVEVINLYRDGNE